MRFTITRIMLISLLVMLFSAVSVFGASLAEQYVKAGLKYGGSAVSASTISCNTGFSIGVADGGVYTESMKVPSYTKLMITMENACVTVRAEDGTLVSADIGSKGCIMPLDYGQGTALSIDGKAYRGGVHFLGNTNNTMNIINYIRMDDYVKGVLNGEMNHDYPIEALKAQAVAARSFALLNLDKHVQEGFNLCTNTHCQVYKGFSDEYSETNQAVDETAGLALYYDGQPVGGYYYKNSGGYTQDAQDVWGSKHGYLKARPDPYSPDYPWTATFTFEELSAKLAAANFNVGQVKSVAITEKCISGAAKTVTFTGSGGTAKLQREQMRTTFGYSAIKSAMFSITGQLAGNSGIVQNSTDLWLSNGSLTAKNPKTVTILSGSGETSNVAKEQIYITNGQSTAKQGSAAVTENPTIPAGSELVTQSPVTFTGKGYGHGVGMPQDSAINMAKQGFTYIDILKYYYTDIEIK